MLIGQDATRIESLDDLLGPGLAALLDRLDLLSRKVFGGKLPGERRSRRRGRSVEFDDFRPYLPGDDLRHVDWNVLARLEKLVIKLFREDEDLALYLVVDASASMNAGEPSKLLAAHRIAMALGYIGLVNRARVVSTTFGAGRVATLRPLRGRPSIERLADFLLKSAREGAAQGLGGGGGTDAGSGGAFERAMRAVSRSRSGRGVVVLISDMLIRPESAAAGLSYLAGGGGSGRGGGFEAFVIQTLSPGEIEPQTLVEKGLVGDLRLMDAETGRAAEVTITGDVIRAYMRNFERHQGALVKACAARSITHVLVPTTTGADELILRSLRSRRLVG